MKKAYTSVTQRKTRHQSQINWIRLATNPSWLDSSIGRAAVSKPEDASSNPARDNDVFRFSLQCQINMNLVFPAQ